jgi:predicted AAA+ superfamily ATPase
MPPSKPTLFPRFVSARVHAALADTPVVMLNGPRQCGKTTLVRTLIGTDHAYITLDDDTVLAAARHDPASLLKGLDKVVIDEVQRAPELLRAIKKVVDEDRRPGRFLLTGSANVLTLPQVSESLAGRMAVIDLLPLSQAEIRGVVPVFLDSAFGGQLPELSAENNPADMIDRVLAGGYPEMLLRTSPQRRRAWARDYVRAIVQRDIRDIAGIDKLDQLQRLLNVIAHYSGQLTNFTQVGGQLGLDGKTIRKYLGTLEQVFLIRRIEPWFDNRLKRLIKTPKLHFLDAGLLATVQGMTAERLTRNRTAFGPLLETFVLAEVMKQITWQDEVFSLHHYRDKDQDEVDIVLQSESGELIGIEVKAASSVNEQDFKGLRKLAGATKARFKAGIVVYDGDLTVAFGEKLFAAPIRSLWA